ncbi:hypothetical protein [Candidatus Methanodesulfokora washburnensis]|uniref:Uncharacterized protein n=1 Tax=Candidatus Methanodesulfokora washburnensis TaxID=2478471 RepID=A0A429GWU0_9CREN|nr:hypothetical protein [Candidatus Methanodesulfokores washburnensis]RSN78425.1 hypothetical protein D6D85_00960 [Candidatus Methanodesulfokores washburnensis]
MSGQDKEREKMALLAVDIARAGYVEILAHPEQLLLALAAATTAHKVSMGSILEDYESLIRIILERANELKP